MESDSPIYPILGRFHFTKQSHFDKSSLEFQQSAVVQKLSGVLGSVLARCRLDDDAEGGSNLLKLHLTTPAQQVL